jgi:DNA gyrase/topoisomerase IV subunit B
MFRVDCTRDEVMIKKQKEKFKILNDIEHVLLRPNMYIGSTSVQSKSILIDFEYKDVQYVPGLFKILNEIIDNSVDEYVRTEGKFANKIEVTMTDDTFTVKDNGRGIPVEQVVDTDGKKLYKPVAAWTKPRAGTNFGDDAERVTMGMNGVGSALSNIFSKSFVGETCDGKKHLIVTCENNAQIKSVKIHAAAKRFTQVSLVPDFTRFDAKHFDDTLKNMIKDRLVNVSLAYPKIQFKFNGIACSISPKAFLTKLEGAVTHIDQGVSLGIMPSGVGEFRHHTVVNGLIIYNGGSHVDYVMNALIPLIQEKLNKKYKFDLTPAKVKAHLQLVLVINGFKNPKFDSQAKEKITNSKAEVSQHLAHIDYEALAKSIMRNEAIIEPIIRAQQDRRNQDDEDDANDKAKELRNKRVAKHIAATSRIADKKTLFIVEGDSALAPFIVARNPETQGALPLQGKILNVFGKKNKEILDNKAITNLMVVIGLELGKPARNLNYGTIAIMTDADFDGGAIQGLLLNLFYKWPELFEQGRIRIVNSPKHVLRGKKDRKYFYTDEEWKSYKGPTAGYEHAYIKGLGSLEDDEYMDILKDPQFETIVVDDPSLFEMMYGDDSDPRKKFMME